MRVRAPVNYSTETGGTGTPGWLKAKTTPRVFSKFADPGDAAKQAGKDKENARVDQKQIKKHSPASAGKYFG